MNPFARWTSHRLALMFLLVTVVASTQLIAQDSRSQQKNANASLQNDVRLPNIVLIISDDQAWNDYGFMGHPHIETPRLDSLAKQSFVYTRGYVPTSLCRPSLATLITGLYPSQHGITGNDPRPTSVFANEASTPQQKRQAVLDGNQMFAERMSKLNTIPRLLQEKGYRSFQSGKWWEGNFSNGGFDQGMTHGDPKRGGRHGDEGLKIGRKGLKPIYDFIEADSEKPFFIWYAPFLPHTPHQPPQKLLEKYQSKGLAAPLARYYAMCEWFDQTCGELLDYLEAKKHAEHTVIIYVTDNGWIQRTPKTEVPEGWRPQFAPRSKQSPYEGGIRTPIMIRWPGQLESKMDKTRLASTIDIAPTILGIAGIEPDSNMLGVDLVKMANGNGSKRKRIWGEIFAHDMSDLKNPKSSLLYRWCIDGFEKVIEFHDGDLQRYKAIHKRKSRDAEYFDLKSDPHEMRNLAIENPYRIRALREWIFEMAADARWVKIK